MLEQGGTLLVNSSLGGVELGAESVGDMGSRKMSDEERRIIEPLITELRELRKYWNDEEGKIRELSRSFSQNKITDFESTMRLLHKELEKARSCKEKDDLFRQGKNEQIRDKYKQQRQRIHEREIQKQLETAKREAEEAEHARQERSNCGICGSPAEPKYGSNDEIIRLRLSKSYIRCNNCPPTIQFNCRDCGCFVEKNIDSSTIEAIESKRVCQKCDEIRIFRMGLSSFEAKLANSEACVQEYPPSSGFTPKEPLFCVHLDNPPLKETPFEDGVMMRRVYRPTKDNEHNAKSWVDKRTVEINRLTSRIPGRTSMRGVYHKSWLRLLADYEEYISSHCKIVRIEIDRWRWINDYGTNTWDYPITLHYHLLLRP